MSQPSRTFRFRRRHVVPIRWTWLGQVFVMLLLLHQLIVRGADFTHVTTQAALFVAVVVVPFALAVLWRMGLLPPERVPSDE